jgi:hypothetical protein
VERQARTRDGLGEGFAWNGETYGSLSQIAKAMTGTSWNGHRFFGLRTAKSNQSATADPTGEVNGGAPLDQDGKVRRGIGSLSNANRQMALVGSTGRRESTKVASP